MKKLLLLTMFLFVTAWWANAQISQGGTPPSFKHGIYTDVDRVTLHPKDMKFIMDEELKLSKSGYLPHIGYNLECDIDMNNSGTWTDLPDGGRIWQVQIKSPGALAQVVYYDKFHLPYGAKLFLYNEDKSQVLGAYTYENNDESGVFANELVYGDIVNIEYYEPARVAGTLKFHIDHVGYIYRGVADRKNPTWTEPSDPCEINVNCSPVGDNWQDEKKGVARILVSTPQGQGWCTGSLVNNTNQDCTPYFLTAWHCYENATTTQLNQWIFYFNYEASGCTTPTTEPSSNTMTGCTLKAAASITGGSDFLLVQLKSTVPTNYNPYMNGWDRNNSVSGPGVGIHHPAASIKKISTYNSATSSTYTGSASNAHWRVVWVSNSNGWGVTEGGSSGSPLFNSAGNIVGTLTGGSSYCTAQSSPDYYGKMYYHWDQNGSTSSVRLKDWLDPTNSGVTSLSGKNCGTGGSTLNADFTASATNVYVGQTVTFTNTSSGSPTTFNWNFGSGASPATSTSAGPINVTYSTTGLKTVTLTVGNGSTTDTETKTNYINVMNQTTTCDTLHLLGATDTLKLYTATNNGAYAGYVSGNNSWADKEKADYFDTYVSTKKLNSVIFYFGVGKGSNTSNVPVKVYNNTGTGGVPGSTALATQNLSLGTIKTDVTNQAPTLLTFTTPVTVTTPFYISVVLPTAAGDTVSLYTVEKTTNTAWEKWSDNSWVAYSDANSWGFNAQLSIWPIMCPTGSQINELNNVPVSIYPNPAQNGAYVVMPYPADTKVNLTLTDVFGKTCKNIEVTTTNIEPYFLDMNSLPDGIYIIKGESKYGKFVERITKIK